MWKEGNICGGEQEWLGAFVLRCFVGAYCRPLECFIESKQCAHVLAFGSISRQVSYTCFLCCLLDMRCQIILIGGVIVASALSLNGGLQPIWRSDLSQGLWWDLEDISAPFEWHPHSVWCSLWPTRYETPSHPIAWRWVQDLCAFPASSIPQEMLA